MVVTLHATCKMPSPLEIYFSAQQLYFTAECSELYAATESLPHGKYYEFHDSYNLPRYLFGGIWSSFRTVSQPKLGNLLGVERPHIFA
jgi:hypothetical protein